MRPLVSRRAATVVVCAALALGTAAPAVAATTADQPHTAGPVETYTQQYAAAFTALAVPTLAGSKADAKAEEKQLTPEEKAQLTAALKKITDGLALALQSADLTAVNGQLQNLLTTMTGLLGTPAAAPATGPAAGKPATQATVGGPAFTPNAPKTSTAMSSPTPTSKPASMLSSLSGLLPLSLLGG
jgi:hypothetical protein